MKRSKDQLIAQLKNEGLTFKDFTLVHEGDYAVSDADWNYKDVPHLHFVHELVEAVIAVVEDDKIATLNMQKVFGLTLPLAVFNYESGPASQTYYTSWFFWALIVETSYEALGPNRTRVRTSYSIGSSRFFSLFFPLIRWTITRNYENLMSQDIPMRLRRGQLRSWGYSFFKDSPKYGFEKTIDLTPANVQAPASGVPFEPREIVLERELPEGGELMVGRDDHMGLRLVRRKGSIQVFPRMCPHEGASLDELPCLDQKVKCRWHGRVFGPLGILELSGPGAKSLRTERHELVLAGGQLSVKARTN